MGVTGASAHLVDVQLLNDGDAFFRFQEGAVQPIENGTGGEFFLVGFLGQVLDFVEGDLDILRKQQKKFFLGAGLKNFLW